MLERFEKQREAEDVTCKVSNVMQANVVYEYLPEWKIVRFFAMSNSTKGAPIPIELLDEFGPHDVAQMVRAVLTAN